MKGFRFYSLMALLALCPIGLMSQNHENYRLRAAKVVKQMTLDEKISQMHGTSNKQQFRIVLGVERLHIPDLPLCNGPAGLGPAGKGHEGRATALPAPISLAATWDRSAAFLYGQIAGGESADYGNVLLEAPDVNIARTPHNGRTFEGFGEDPFLSGVLSVANIKGIQKEGVMANVKHYAANNQERDRFEVDETIDERTLREIYLPAFEMSVKEGKVASVMAAYNKLNGQHCTENHFLLTDVLKNEWHFDGFITSDFGAVHSTVPCIKAGLDLELPDDKYFGPALRKAIDNGEVAESELDGKLIRRFSTMMKFGVWDKMPERKAIPAENADYAKKLSEDGMVLLKNEKDLLPLSKGQIHSIALIGPYSAKASTGGGGSSRVDPIIRISPEEGMQQFLGSGIKVYRYSGLDADSALTVAKKADAVVLELGDSQSEGSDHSISLGDAQNNLASAVLQAIPQTVVVLKTGGPILMPWIKQCSTLLQAWYPGEEDGLAVAEVLFGKAYPGGKLPITFPVSDKQTPMQSAEQYPGINKEVKYTEGLFVGYRWYDQNKVEPLFPFGYGLSYTNFKLSGMKLTKKGKTANVVVKVENTGKREGSEVVQVYVGLPAEVKDAPEQLKGFSKVKLQPGESKVVSIPLNERAFSYWESSIHGWKVPADRIKVSVGTSSRNLVWSQYVSL
ncbi:MAG: glycoside hydrolase family 3 C-terminal domain-containing protein [Prevotella sp.]|uniref:Glycoside hydrolase family 3 C-terminal domain-containing protein n=1 Tax=Segatella cerevisiae TaxID=2053716 RepID=A0ABT1BYP0_9BACT|nr:glycoside hydrolase family 3 C-terminal domain-containing protein [Segatella cerevisiae]MCH3994187.1 glycoside hydrolase family 3 C-terminal domain-containing protein [Prevotella sp.]MCI1246614.1 glycoside hydrolase family 3 C-terminal domain-containing protein [Prevotella sp.]MCO6026197.1 glycoside hydrolase family 3 C-terminal domain-containing protein [Segatella cerevisiae]